MPRPRLRSARSPEARSLGRLSINIGRFGIKGNVPPAVFGVLYAGLALGVIRGWDHAVLATLVVTAVGMLGLALKFKKLQHDTTVERIVFAVGSATIAYAAYLIFLP